MAKNILYYGDNLEILRNRDYFREESVDLVYLDPPFNSKKNYNVIFPGKEGVEKSEAQLQAFDDTWTWGEDAKRVLNSVTDEGGPVSVTMKAFETLLIDEADGLLAYLTMMAPRLKAMRKVLKPTGSIYLHCDPTASHYLKLLMDAVFGVGHYRNEIVWQRTSAHNDPSQFGRVHDVILFYTKSDSWTWNTQYDEPDKAFFKAHDFQVDDKGRRYRKRDLTAPAHGGQSGQYEWRGIRPPNGRMWSYTEENMKALDEQGKIVYTKTGMPRLKILVDDLKGVPLQDVWSRPSLWLNSAARERLGYPTQKPEALLERIIKASSNEGDVVLDPFCGCGTAIAAAQRLNRRWIGIDITQAAIRVIKEQRLGEKMGLEEGKDYQIIGEPVTVDDAQVLADKDPYQFQWWALGLLGARPEEKKKGADRGIDGRLFFRDEHESGPTKEIILQVKAGRHVSAKDVQALRGAVERDKAAMGVLISMRRPTQPMITEATQAGFYMSPYTQQKYPKIQIVTIEQLLSNWMIDAPQLSQTNVTYRMKRVRSKPSASNRGDDKQGALF